MSPGRSTGAGVNTFLGRIAMTLVGNILSTLAGLGGLVCFVLVLVQMFQRGQSTLGIVLIVLFFCCGIGYFATFIFGWIKNREWNIANIMYIWTACIVVGLIAYAIAPPDLSQYTKMMGGN
jgi:hypothetical protein